MADESMEVTDVSVDPIQVKKSKKKLKKLYIRIKKQMEFYFSDSNLTKDKFLLELISKNSEGYVDLEVFKSFNKIKAITESIEHMSTAVSKSELLEISADGKMVRRVGPLPEPKDFDSCTIYVEKLPLYADQKWMRDVFEQFGLVSHINIPHFKGSGKMKGFAFVEFNSPDSVIKACESYKFSSGKEGDEVAESCKEKKMGKKKKHLQTIQDKDVPARKHPKSKRKSVNDLAPDKPAKNPTVTDENALEKETLEAKSTQPSHQNLPVKKSNKKRKRHGSECEVAPKRVKASSDDIENKTNLGITHCKAKLEQSDILKSEPQITVKQEKKSDQTAVKIVQSDISKSEPESPVKHEKKSDQDPDELHANESLEGNKSTNKRKRHKKNKSNVVDLQLRVMTKADWKSYRNKYLALQRATISHLKQTIMLETQHLREQELYTGGTEAIPEPAKSSWHFIPGVILKIVLQEPVVSSTGIKDLVKSNAVVAYIDAPIGHNEAYVRCHATEDANSIVNEGKLNHLGTVEILKDTEEENYWKKAENDRNIKFSSVLSHKKRGRDKIIAKAAKLVEQKNKHIYFDE